MSTTQLWIQRTFPLTLNMAPMWAFVWVKYTFKARCSTIPKSTELWLMTPDQQDLSLALSRSPFSRSTDPPSHFDLSIPPFSWTNASLPHYCSCYELTFFFVRGESWEDCNKLHNNNMAKTNIRPEPVFSNLMPVMGSWCVIARRFSKQTSNLIYTPLCHSSPLSLFLFLYIQRLDVKKKKIIDPSDPISIYLE